MIPRPYQPAGSEEVLRGDAGGSDASRGDPGLGQRPFQALHRALVGDHGRDRLTGDALVEHFLPGAVVEDAGVFVKGLFAARRHAGHGIAVFGADFGDAVVPQFVVRVLKADPDVHIGKPAGKKTPERLAYLERAARRVPRHALGKGDDFHGLEFRRAAGGALRQQDAAITDIHSDGVPFLAEEGTAGRPPRSGGERGRGSLGGGRLADMIQQLLRGQGLGEV